MPIQARVAAPASGLVIAALGSTPGRRAVGASKRESYSTPAAARTRGEHHRGLWKERDAEAPGNSIFHCLSGGSAASVPAEEPDSAGSDAGFRRSPWR